MTRQRGIWAGAAFAGRYGMLHYVARAVEGRFLFWTWMEARALWDGVAGLPGVVAVCVMPDHVHVLADGQMSAALVRAMRAYARRRNAARAQSGRVWRPLGEPTAPSGKLKRWRDRRYILLNPCRAGLERCPLGWPFSSHRDETGLAVDPVVGRTARPREFHRRVSSDPHCDVQGTAFPEPAAGFGVDASSLPALLDAVSAVTRLPVAAVRRRGAARTLLVRSARTLTTASVPEIARFIGMGERATRAVKAGHTRETGIVDLAWHDPRFFALSDGDLRSQDSWHRYGRIHRIGDFR